MAPIHTIFFLFHMFLYFKFLAGDVKNYKITKILNINKTSPKYITFFFTSFPKKVMSGSKMNLLLISKCPARAFNRSKHCRKSSKNVWIYISLTTILNIIKRSPKYISFFHFINKKNKVGFNNGSVINL